MLESQERNQDNLVVLAADALLLGPILERRNDIGSLSFLKKQKDIRGDLGNI